MGYGYKKRNICKNCNKEYIGYGSLYCSNKCKGLARKEKTIKNGRKKCHKCNKWFDLSYFYKNKINRYSPWCKECTKKQVKKYRKKNPDKIKKLRELYKEKRKEIRKPTERRNHLKMKYGITESDYKTMYNSQNGECLICKKKVIYKKLSIDHCHKTNKIRGLLCFSCNIGLGNFKDNIENLIRAIKYLEKQQDV